MGRPKSRHFNSNYVLVIFYLLLCSIFASGAASAGPARQDSVTSPQPPLLFEENRGQFYESIDYVARGKGYSIILSQQPVVELYRFKAGIIPKSADPDELIQTRPEVEAMARFRIKVLGSREDLAADPLELQQALTHYLVGEQSDWRTDVPNFKRVRYSDILPDIDIEYYGRDGRLEYDFVVHPGGNPGAIGLEFEGAEGVWIDANGDLVIDLGSQEIVQRAPI